MTETHQAMPHRRPEAAVGGAMHSVGESRKPNGVYANEQDWWQHAARYSALRLAPKEIAEALGIHVNTVYAAQKSPEFQEMVCAIMKEQDRDVMELAKGAAVGAMFRLIDLSANAKSETVQVSACKEILDRGFGKPTVFIESDTTTRSGDPVGDIEKLRAEVRALQGRAGV